MRRPTLPLFLLLAACSSLSTEEQQQLAGFQERAARYYEMNDRHLGQAMDMIERGLAIAPDDYKLNALRAAVLLALAQCPERLDDPRFKTELVQLVVGYLEPPASPPKT